MKRTQIHTKLFAPNHFRLLKFSNYMGKVEDKKYDQYLMYNMLLKFVFSA